VQEESPTSGLTYSAMATASGNTHGIFSLSLRERAG
jgi:hypothetical protein